MTTAKLSLAPDISVSVAQLIVSVLTLFGVLTIPDIIREGSDFVQRLKAENAWVVVLEKLRHGVGCAQPCFICRLVLFCS